MSSEMSCLRCIWYISIKVSGKRATSGNLKIEAERLPVTLTTYQDKERHFMEDSNLQERKTQSW
jgi:hypothetical protein